MYSGKSVFLTTVHLPQTDPKKITFYLYVRRARALTKEGNFTDALYDLHFAKRFDPQNARIELYLSRIYQKLDQGDAALDSVNDALVLKPRYADALAHRTTLYLATGAPDKAVKDYEAAIDSTSYRQDRFHLKIGQIRMAGKAFDDAVTQFRKAHEINTKNSAAWKAETKALLILKRKIEATNALRQYVLLNPDDKDIKTLEKQIDQIPDQ